MSLVFAGHIPNDPKLVTDNFSTSLPKDEKSLSAAISEIEGELYFMKPDTVIFLTEHQVMIPEMINMQVAPHFEHELFHGATIKTDMMLTSELKGSIEVQQHTIPLTIVAENILDPRIAGPIALMMRHLSEHAKIIILAIPLLSTEILSQVGEFLKREIMRTDRRVALFSTGHISALNEAESMGSVQTVNRLIEKCIADKQFAAIPTLNRPVVRESGCDSLAPLTVFFSCVRDINFSAEIFAYETQREETNMVLNCILQ